MKTEVKKLLDLTESSITIVLNLLLALSIFVIGYQVFMRYVLGVSPYWSEELARFCNVAITMFGASIAIRSKMHVSLDFINSIISEGAQKYLDVVNSLLCLLFFLILTYSSYLYCFQAGQQKSPGLEISMYIPYGLVTLSAAIGILYSAEMVLKTIHALSGKTSVDEVTS